MTFQTLLTQYRHIAFSERDKGDRFERLMKAYLQTDPHYAPRFARIWLWHEFPSRSDLGGRDSGIDLVAQTHGGDYWAIQCKCFAEDTTIDKPAVDTFLATSSREFKHHETMRTTRFAHRLWISTTNRWGPNADEAIKNQRPPVSRINLHDLNAAPVDWEKLEQGVHGADSRTAQKRLRPHQQTAVDRTHAYFQHADRGKLIMACGTGKTFTALRIAEQTAQKDSPDGTNGLVLFLVPSIALLGQTLRAWSADAQQPLHAICICSDPQISRARRKNDDLDSFSVVDLALPASTDPDQILHQFEQIRASTQPAGLTVVFSTYQSIAVIAKAQETLRQHGFPPFDLIICDEAHRTTGVILSKEEESAFTKVHDANFIQAKKRLYMTATPRLYSDDSKSKAQQAEVILCSMDDPALYGEEIYHLGFGEAVEHGLLTDYRVLILTLSDRDVPPAVQRMLATEETEINADDASKLIGCLNALSKQFLGDNGYTKTVDPLAMRRAVAFCQNLKISNRIANSYNRTSTAYIDTLPAEKRETMVSIEARHIDGTMTAPARDEMLAWLKADSDTDEQSCRILTNVRVLSEGVDVPSLDAVLFLASRSSQVEVVQSVGRVMRRAEGKQYGYIIIPVITPADVPAHQALADNKRYEVVWKVLNALRAHDDRFNATVNKIELNKHRPEQILVGRPETSFDENGQPIEADGGAADREGQAVARQMHLQFEQLQEVVYARLVEKVGDRRYWEQWASDIALIANRQIERISHLIASQPDQRAAFDRFLAGLRHNINPSISPSEAVEMLAQHLITEPIFSALFQGYAFAQRNPVSSTMQGMLDALDGRDTEIASASHPTESDTLARFYDSMRKRASGIDNAEGKQRIIIELYDKFFKTAFPKMAAQLGIVYTPVEVVDFIIHSVEAVLQQSFGRTLSDENVHILDPFTGTGTFITRLLHSGLIRPEDVARKYQHELHANEIVLLAYYIAAVNIENAYHDLQADDDYQPFDGIVLTDTFQLNEYDLNHRLPAADYFPQNSARVDRQRRAPLRVIMGNPPYSVGQRSANDNAQNQKYERLDQRIEQTYAQNSQATSVKSLYDAYIKAFRWSTDRLDPEHGGVIAFVSNGAWLDSNSTDGFRKLLREEFSQIWVLNLRGNQRTSGERSRKEGGKVFGSGSRATITITLLVKQPQAGGPTTIHYRDIGDYLSRDEKLSALRRWASVAHPDLAWRQLTPDAHHDWLNQRNDQFGEFIPLAPDTKFNTKSQSFFVVNSLGLNTNRDVWVYNSSEQKLLENVTRMVRFYNQQVAEFEQARLENKDLVANDFIDRDPTKISWSSSLIPHLERGSIAVLEPNEAMIGLYRPFFKQQIYRGEKLIHRRGQFDQFFPTPEKHNLVICVSAPGGTKPPSVIITDCIPDLHLNGDTQCFPLYHYQAPTYQTPTLFDWAEEGEYNRLDGLTDFILKRAQKIYGRRVSKEDIFYYVYGLLHSPTYRATFANDLKKSLPRLPLLDSAPAFWAFSQAGRALADLHLNYETVLPCPTVEVSGTEHGFLAVEKMRFAKKEGTVRGKRKKVDDRQVIHFNSKITLRDIPERAYDYVVNGKSAIEWVMERYQVKVDKKSGIKNDPNDWASETNQPRYILDLLLSVINLSLQTVEVVAGLPEFRP